MSEERYSSLGMKIAKILYPDVKLDEAKIPKAEPAPKITGGIWISRPYLWLALLIIVIAGAGGWYWHRCEQRRAEEVQQMLYREDLRRIDENYHRDMDRINRSFEQQQPARPIRVDVWHWGQ